MVPPENTSQEYMTAQLNSSMDIEEEKDYASKCRDLFLNIIRI